MTTFKTPYNYDYKDSVVYERPTGVSITVPEQSLTVREIFERYRVGRPLDIVSRNLADAYPDGPDPDFDDYNHLEDPDSDLVDQYEAAQRVESARNAMNRLSRKNSAEAVRSTGQSESDVGEAVTSSSSEPSESEAKAK